MPEKLVELQQLFLIEVQIQRLPTGRPARRAINPEIAGRPDLMGRRTSLTLYRGMIHLMENAVLNVKNKSYSVTAELEIPEGGAKA